MPPKKKPATPPETAKKRQRRSWSLDDKMKMIRAVDAGSSYVQVAREFNTNESTVRTVVKNREEVTKHFSEALPRSAVYVTRVTKDPFLQSTEKAVFVWLQDCYAKSLPVASKHIMVKAKSVHTALMDRSDMDAAAKEQFSNFHASRGWLQNFIKRYDLSNKVVSGESASADKEAAERYPAEFRKVVTDGGYQPCQVFNADETALFWKRMPDRTYVARKEAKIALGDPSFERRESMIAGINRILRPYVEIYRERRKQSQQPLITTFFRRTSASPPPEPRPGPSGASAADLGLCTRQPSLSPPRISTTTDSNPDSPLSFSDNNLSDDELPATPSHQ